jgi:Bacterial Ig domain
LQNLSNNNIQLLQFESSNIQNNRIILQNAKNNGYKKLLINVVDNFYTSNGTAINTSEQKFLETLSVIEQSIDGFEDSIYAFYFDEPTWNNVDQNYFVDFTVRLKNRFPNIGRMLVEAYPSVRIPFDNVSFPTVPPQLNSNWLQNITDVGFDHYLYTDNQNALANYKVINQTRLNALMQIANNNQKIWLIPDGYSNNINCNTNRDYLKNALIDFNDIANTNSRVIGILPYLYFNGAGSSLISLNQIFNATDACNFSAIVKNEHILIGQNIINGKDVTSPLKPILNTISGGPTNYVFNGTSEPNSVIKVFDNNGILFNTGITNSLGNFSISVTIINNSSNKLKFFSIDNQDNWSNPFKYILNGYCSYKSLPNINNDTNIWGDNLNSFICQSLEKDGINSGKLKSNLSSLTSNGKIGIGTNNPTNTFAIIGLQTFASPIEAIAAGLRNGDVFLTNSYLQIVTNGLPAINNTHPNNSDSDCFNSIIPTRLPTDQADDNNWGTILNNFLCKSISNSTGQEGKLKSDLGSICLNGKVGIGIDIQNSVFAIGGLNDNKFFHLKNGDIYYVNDGGQFGSGEDGILKVYVSGENSNINTTNAFDCYNSSFTTRLPKQNLDIANWGSILNNFLCRTFLNGTINAGKIKSDLSIIVENGKVGIGIRNPNSVLAIANLPNYTGNVAAKLAGLVIGDVYIRNGKDLMIVY